MSYKYRDKKHSWVHKDFNNLLKAEASLRGMSLVRYTEYLTQKAVASNKTLSQIMKEEIDEVKVDNEGAWFKF